jgi:hypothetical protein
MRDPVMLSSFKRQYLSDIDKFLTKFDADHPEKSVSQQKEIAKHAKIARWRDGISLEKSSGCDEAREIWKDF